ncbi:hypothetical protein NC652_019749 [Populus alba x Populus x berolinensis]|nr:hypothetical protein NC652_019749 [Populus alba x Populus x berolinensis]
MAAPTLAPHNITPAIDTASFSS